MAGLNIKPKTIYTHEGAPAKHINAELMLRRSVMSCMLWENEFYEDGQSIAARIAELVPKVLPELVAQIALDARNLMKLRHVPLLLVREMARYDSHKKLVAPVLHDIIQRADELAEFLAIYWKDGRQPLSAQVKKGLALAFAKFDEYQLAKYNRAKAVKLKDVLKLCHPKPINAEQADLWKRLKDDQLKTPDTWETSLSAGTGKKSNEDKREQWTRLLKQRKMGAMAILRNLRNFEQTGVDESLIRASIKEMDARKVLPFRYIAAALHAHRFEPELEESFKASFAGKNRLPGKTALLIDVSGSMDYSRVSGKSEMTRMEAACGLAMVASEVCNDGVIYTFSKELVSVPPRRGFALRDAIVKSQVHASTYLGSAISDLYLKETFDRLMIITDEQSHDRVPDPLGKAYVISVASNRNGVGYGAYTHIDGWSEAVIDYIIELEKNFG